MVDILIRFSLPLQVVDYSDIQIIVINIIGIFIRIAFFAYGLFQATKNTLSLKKKGAVILVYLGATYITGSESENITRWQRVSVGITLIF